MNEKLTEKELMFWKFFDKLYYASHNLNYNDYIEIWGEQLGSHIWRQEKNDILRIWKSGLTTKQKTKFFRFIINIQK